MSTQHKTANRIELFQGTTMLTGGFNNPVTVQSKQRIITENMAMNVVSPGFLRTMGVPFTQQLSLF
jgi:hypothetical protein